MISTRQICRPLRLVGPLQLRDGQVNALVIRSMHLYRRLMNENIPHPYVQIVNADGKLDPPRALSDILASIDHKTLAVQLVRDQPPIVKVLNKQEGYQQMKALQKTKKAAGRQENKEIQMSWGVAIGDLAHKMTKVRAELERGNRVTLIFAGKKRQPVPSPSERNDKVDEVLDMLKDIGQETRPRTVLRSHLTLHLAAKPMDAV